MNFPRKEYGRIYVEKKEDVQKVKDIIKEMDEFEFGYLPKNMIAVFEGQVDTTYTHKFCDLDIGLLMEKCWQQGIKMFCVNGQYGTGFYD